MFGHTVGKPLGLGYVENDRGVADAAFNMAVITRSKWLASAPVEVSLQLHVGDCDEGVG
jgi:hypothetical protein